MTRYFEAPHPAPALTMPSVFLAGGITGCPDWQADATAMLLRQPRIVIVNPRRADFPMGDPDAGREQIIWEQRNLHAVDVTLFWFPRSRSVQPIALYELGQALGEGRRIAVGADPGFPRIDDVVVQCGFNRPDLTVHTDLGDTVADAVSLLSVEVEPVGDATA
jgi:hypothetical protein